MALRLPGITTDDERLDAWCAIVERIRTEQTAQAWQHKIFRAFRTVFETNQRLSEEGGFLFNTIAETYVDSALMLIRREWDLQNSTENLRNLLDDIGSHPEVLTRARYLAKWGSDQGDMANRSFDTFSPIRILGAPERDHIDPLMVRADLDRGRTDAEQLRGYAERTRAHRTPMRGVDPSFTFADLHNAIDDTRAIIKKYYAMLTQKVITEWEPVEQFDLIAPFLDPWVVNGVHVKRLMQAKIDEIQRA